LEETMTLPNLLRPAAAAALLLGTAAAAPAQTWTGFYVGGQVGGGFLRTDDDKVVVFDKNLDGAFTDTVTTAAGANAFSPGFCAGSALAVTPGGGCQQDDSATDAGFRLGYDWQRGRFVVGATGEVSRVDFSDSVSAFSTTPASYAFTREVEAVGALGARVGVGGRRLLVYASGGGAWGSVSRSFVTSNRVNRFVPAEQGEAWGYQVGGGLEYRLGRVGAGVQYLYTRLNDTDKYTVRAQGPAPATNPFILANSAGTDLRRADDFEFQSVRFTASYRF
jgi:outer membrane immunogenic protein